MSHTAKNLSISCKFGTENLAIKQEQRFGNKLYQLSISALYNNVIHINMEMTALELLNDCLSFSIISDCLCGCLWICFCFIVWCRFVLSVCFCFVLFRYVLFFVFFLTMLLVVLILPLSTIVLLNLGNVRQCGIFSISFYCSCLTDDAFKTMLYDR